MLDEQTAAPTSAPVPAPLPPVRRPDLMAGAHVTPIVPRSIEEVFRVAKAVIMAGLAPDSYTREKGQDLPEDKVISRVVIGIMKGAEVGLPPITALSTIAIINNRPCIYGAGAVALIQASGVLQKMVIEDIGEQPGDDAETGRFSKAYGKRVTMWRIGQTEPYIGEFTVADAGRAHLWMNPRREPWIKTPKDMLFWRAFSRSATKGFSDCLMGLAIREIVEDMPPEAPEKADVSFLNDDPAPQLAAPTETPVNTVTNSPGASEPEPASTSHGESPSNAAGGEDAPASVEPSPAPGEPEDATPGPTVLEMEPEADENAVIAWCKVAAEILSIAPTPRWINEWLAANQSTLNRIKTAGPKGVRYYKRLVDRASERVTELRSAA